ncbi:MAG: SRPBCC family protein [Prevotella sp.]|nr:SRPBCC family protein [Prevotella sp.]
MSKFESSVKQIPYSQEAVYRNISDLTNLERVRDRIPADKVQDFTFTRDSVSVNAPMVGQIAVQVVEREEPKCVKFGSQQSPVPFNVWIQVLPVDEQSSKMKLTVDADIPFFMKGMISGPLQEGLEKIADALSKIPYE